jgi:Predicted membrane protein (DUF2254)
MARRETPTIRAPRQLPLPVFALIVICFFGFLTAINRGDFLAVFELSDDFNEKRAMVNNLSRSSTALISTVFACLFLAIPLTANMYTPQLIELFVGSWTNRLVLAFYVFSAAYALSLGRVAVDVDVPTWHFKLSATLVLLSLLILIPYLFSVFRFLDPRTIIRRVGAHAMRALDPKTAGSIESRRKDLTKRLRQLGNIALKSLERSDRDVALGAIEALDACAARYLEVKEQHRAEWFLASTEQFPGLAHEALDFVNSDRVWVEMEIQRQLSRAFSAALAKVPDVISAIARVQHHTIAEASARGDAPALDLGLRYFNNFMREAVKRRDIHAIYDLLYQFRMLGEELWPRHPSRVVQAARHLDYYGRLARDGGLPFAYDLTSYDMGALLARVPDACPEHATLLDVFLEIGHQDAAADLAPGVFKARVVTAAKLRHRGYDASAEKIESTLEGAGPALISAAERDVIGGTEPWFWEVTDRMCDLNYLPAEERQRAGELIERMRYAAP